jgi:hypothetical protein
LRPRLAFLSGAADDVRDAVRRARARRRSQVTTAGERKSADEVVRRLDETRTRLRSEIPPRED